MKKKKENKRKRRRRGKKKTKKKKKKKKANEVKGKGIWNGKFEERVRLNSPKIFLKVF